MDLNSFISDPPSEFAIIEQPDQSLEICIGPFESCQLPGRKSVFFCDFFLSGKEHFLHPTENFRVGYPERQQFISEYSQLENAHIDWHSLDDKLFERSFRFFKTAISDGILKKAVPVSFLSGHINNPVQILPQLIFKLIKGKTGLYSYALRRKDFMMLGASPEILFNLQNNQISSEAVAGSILGPSAPVSQITDKLLEEQQLVVDDLQQQLSAFGKVAVSEVKLKNLSSLCHLKSDISVDCHKKINPEKLIRQLHPSGALGLLPRKPLDHELLQALDLSGTRASFGAPFGIMDIDGSAQIIVAIRNLIIEGNTVRLGAGVGITAKSDFASELNEIKAKHLAVKNFFGLTDGQ